MRLLADFYAAMVDRYKDDPNVGTVWRFNEYDTKFGSRQEIAFVGHYITFVQMPVNLGLSLIVHQSDDRRVYTQAAFLMNEAMSYLTTDTENIYVSIHGQAYQAFVGLRNFYVEPEIAEGVVMGDSDIYGNPKEILVKKIVGVRVRKNHQITRV